MKPINFLNRMNNKEKNEIYGWLAISIIIFLCMLLYCTFNIFSYIPKNIMLSQEIKKLEDELKKIDFDLIKSTKFAERRKKLENMLESQQKKICNGTDLSCIITHISKIVSPNSINSLLLSKKKLDLLISVNEYKQLLTVLKNLEEESTLSGVELTHLTQIPTTNSIEFQCQISALIQT